MAAADWNKLQSAFGLTRTLGGSEALAWTVQTVVALLAAAAVAIVWRSPRFSFARTPSRRGYAYEVKAAALGAGAMLATPYLYTYDLVVLAVPLAFLFRLARARGALPHEMSRHWSRLPAHPGVPVRKAPVGFAAVHRGRRVGGAQDDPVICGSARERVERRRCHAPLRSPKIASRSLDR